MTLVFNHSTRLEILHTAGQYALKKTSIFPKYLVSNEHSAHTYIKINILNARFVKDEEHFRSILPEKQNCCRWLFSIM